MNKNPLLEINHLVTEFHTEEGVVKAVNDVSFLINKGETVGVVGESGSGKSVTSLSVMQLIPNPPGKITNGEILFHSEKGVIDLLKCSQQEMMKHRGNDVAMIFQEPMTSLNPVYTCGKQVAEAIMLHQKVGFKTAKAQTLELFQQVDLPRPTAIFDAYPHQISGGQKQRVMIAMAMSCNPSVLIADEPTTALDVTVQKTILELMQQLQQKRAMGILFITHDLGVVAEIADKVVVMYKGKVVEQGSVLAIFSNPQHPYTKGLLACRPPLKNRLKALPTVADFMTIDADGKMQETHRSVEEITTRLIIPPHKTAQRLEKLYHQSPILEVKNLSTHFPLTTNFWGKTTTVVKAVDNVSFDVYPGETLGLVGESGCGKTTLGRTLLKLVEPSSGTIVFKGKDITHLNPKEMRTYRKEMQLIFQDPYSSLNPRITIGEAIMEPMRVHQVFDNEQQRKARVIELLKRVSLLETHFDRYPHEFSGGQRQRICIARSLALNPKFIICDESVSALDVSVQAQVLNLLNELKEEFKFTFIFISHDLSVVKFMSDRMVVMQQGKVVELRLADDIYENPETNYTKALIAAIPKGELKDIKNSFTKKNSITEITYG